MVTSKAKAGLSLADREMVAMGQELKNLAQKEYYRRFVEALELYGMSTGTGDGNGGLVGRDYSSKTSSWSKIARFMGDEVSVAEVKKYAYRYLMYIQSRNGDGAPPSGTGTGTAVSHTGGTAGPLPVTDYFNPHNTNTNTSNTNSTNTHHSVPTLTPQSTQPATDSGSSDGWTVEEDILLETILVPYHDTNRDNNSDESLAEELILTHDWQRIASIIPGKTAWQVEHRYRTHLVVERERNRTNQDVGLAREMKQSGSNTQSGTNNLVI